MVPAASRWVSRAPRYSGCPPGPRRAFRLRGSHSLRPAFPGPSARRRAAPSGGPYNPGPPTGGRPGLGSSAFARRYWRNHCCFLFLRVLRWFTSPGSPRRPPGRRRRECAPAGFPHSDTPGSKLACSSPRIFAAGRVLLRLLLPRHPPRALSSLPVRLAPGRPPQGAPGRRYSDGAAPPGAAPPAIAYDLRLFPSHLPKRAPVGAAGLEPAASSLSGMRSDRLSYAPRRRWSWPASNRRPPGCKPDALPAELQPPRAGPDAQARSACRAGAPARAWRARKAPPVCLKEVIQPQVLLRLPCYDFTPIMRHTVGRRPPGGLARGLLVQPTFVM